MRLYVTGSVCVEADGAALDEARIPGSKAVIALAVLAVEHRRPLPRQLLADVLWPGVPAPRSEGNLRSVISRLRTRLRHLGDNTAEKLVATRGCYRLELSGDDWVDLDEAVVATHAAETAARSGDYRRAATTAWVAESITRRGFLENSDAALVEDHRRALTTTRVRCLDTLSLALSKLGDHAGAIRHAEVAVAADPFRELSHQRLILACASAGNHAGAARAYENCASLLAAELGIAPSPATLDAYRGVVTPAPPPT